MPSSIGHNPAARLARPAGAQDKPAVTTVRSGSLHTMKKFVLVTGASRGFGKCFCEKLVARYADEPKCQVDLVVTARDLPALHKLKAELEKTGKITVILTSRTITSTSVQM